MNGVTTTFTMDTLTSLSAGSGGQNLRRFRHTDQNLLSRRGSDANQQHTHYILKDHLGSASVVTDSTGA
ncbi:MAG TPA: hypothetical protein VN653_17055, partial [Anaerolineales bacterium]|nr:hypothetical protein [Anaerolineales bacterium]